jgi:hypothetical protein
LGEILSHCGVQKVRRIPLDLPALSTTFLERV